MSTPSASPPPADSVPSADSVPTAAPPPAVPYGPGPGEPTADATPFSTSVTAEGVAKGAGSTVVKWGIRILLPLLIRAIFRALARR